MRILHYSLNFLSKYIELVINKQNQLSKQQFSTLNYLIIVIICQQCQHLLNEYKFRAKQKFSNNNLSKSEMSFFHLDIQKNQYERNEIQKKVKVALALDSCFQHFPYILAISKNWDKYEYSLMLQTQKWENIQVVLQIILKSQIVRFKFKPILLININLSLITNNFRCIIQLNKRIQKRSKQSKINAYKLYINEFGYLNIEIGYSTDQLLSPLFVNFIVNKTICDVNMILAKQLQIIIPYLRIQNNLIVNESKNQNQLEKDISLTQKINYMSLLAQVYKKHRNDANFSQQKMKQKAQNQFNYNIQSLCKANVLMQDDLIYIESIQKNKKQADEKLKVSRNLINMKIQNKRNNLNMYKMYMVQKQFEKYVKKIKKKHLDIYQITYTQYRIVRGIQDHISLSQLKILSDQGSHSDIFYGNYSLHLSDTLFTYSNNINEEENQKKVVIKPLVCKKIKNKELQSSINSFKNQIDFLFYVKDKRSKFVASYFLPMSKSKDQTWQIFSQYYQLNLKEYLQKRKKTSQLQLQLDEILYIAENILLSLIFMVQNGILHRDLKPYNIMIDQKVRGRLIDFGSCCPIYNKKEFVITQKRMLTTPFYQLGYKQCPQQVRKSYTKQQFQQHILFDIYSYGKVLKEMLDYISDLDIFKSKKGVQIREVLQLMIEKCKQSDPLDRVTFDQLLYFIQLLKQFILQ